jgi:hypothetical protein
MSEIPWDIIANVGWVVTLLTLLGIAYKIGRWTQKIEDRYKKIEENPLIIAGKNLPVEVISDALYESFEKKHSKTNPLTPKEIRLRRELTERLDSGTITPEDAKILHSILQKELTEARDAGNILAVLLILLLIGLVVAFLSQ